MQLTSFFNVIYYNFNSNGTRKYYIVGSDTQICLINFLASYRGERYHLRDYRGRGRQQRGPQEFSNHRHSSLRNVIERCFGVLGSILHLKVDVELPNSKQCRISNCLLCNT